MATTTKKSENRIKPLPEAREKRLVTTIETTFKSRSADFRKGAIVYGRKLLKLNAGLRASRPPVPPALMSDDREKTRATCASVAKALGLDPVKMGLATSPTVAEDLQDAVAEKTKSKPKAAAKPKTAAKGAEAAANGKERARPGKGRPKTKKEPVAS